MIHSVLAPGLKNALLNLADSRLVYIGLRRQGLAKIVTFLSFFPRPRYLSHYGAVFPTLSIANIINHHDRYTLSITYFAHLCQADIKIYT